MSKDLLMEALGASLLLHVIVGSGIAAETLSQDPGVQLFAHAFAVGIGLEALIAVGQTVSGSHFNPAVTLGFWRTGSMTAAGLLAAAVAASFYPERVHQKSTT